MSTLSPFDSIQDSGTSSPDSDNQGAAFSSSTCAILGLIPGLGIVMAPLAIVQGARDRRTAQRFPQRVSSATATLSIILGALGVLIQLSLLVALFWMGNQWLQGSAIVLKPEDKKEAESKDDKEPAKPVEGKKVKIGDNVFLENLGNRRRVLVESAVCLREGQLEQLLTRKRMKEHEAILAADVDARNIHAALLLAGAKEGSPVKFAPKYEPAHGSTIKITLQYLDKAKLVTVPAQQWVRDSKTRKHLEADWVFGGSRLVDVPDEENKKYYLANEGDVICVSNFETAMLDLPIKSPKDDANRAFEAFSDRIPPLGTKVTLILEPVPEKK